MLDRDEADRLPVVIPQEDIDNDPEAFAWYDGPQGALRLYSPIPVQKIPKSTSNETPMGYLHYIVNKCNWYTKDVHSLGLFDAIGIYFEGLMEYAEDHYVEFIVPGFSRKHRGKRLQQCRDKPWMEWTTTRPDLTQKYIVYFTAVRYLLDNPRHYTANRDIGELLSVTQYEDDLDLVEEDDDEYEINSIINDDDAEEEQEQEQESSETADDSEASSCTEVETTQPSDVEGSQSSISGGNDSESSMWTPPRTIPVNSMTSLGSTYRLDKRHNSCSPRPVPMPPSPTPRKRRKGPGSSEVNSVSKASPRKRKFSSVDSSDHLEDLDDAEKDKPEKSQRRQKDPRKGKQKTLTSEMKDFLSGDDSEESNGNEDYVGSATENDNLSDLADGSKRRLYTSSINTQCGIPGAQPHQLRSGREYGPDKSRLNKETAPKEASRPTSRDRESPGVIRSAISSANDSGSDELSIRGSTPRRTSSPDAQGISRRRPPELGPTHAYVPNSHQAASSSKRRRTAYRVVSSSEDESRSPSPELYQPTESRSASPERPVRRFRRLRRWSKCTA
ncbi:hypothetical protein IW261DRAFT_1651790 [Armillaria novae-zelandiae]|uniref:Uncharacterized protein n=1 Tax=Armillaria novae-zelandiae TaxID=153914 RepID=A0AA39NY87_9AGAR|nr:hypothetical protein IW261DRAFT_1651790 [Armillaria novae-zelandiae]